MGPELNVAKELLREEQTKCKACGQKNGYNLQALDRGMTPVVLEQLGRTAPGAQAIFKRIINHCLQFLVRQGSPSHMQRASPAPSCGALFPALCSEQHGRHTRSVLPRSAWPIWERLPPACQTPPGRCSETHETHEWLVFRPERSDTWFAKRLRRQFATFCDNFRLFVPLT